jgi:hypothetical protein
MSLGDKLKKILYPEGDSYTKKSKENDAAISWFEEWRARVVADIERGKAPDSAVIPRHILGIHGEDYESIDDPNHKVHWLWRDHIQPWAESEQLLVEIWSQLTCAGLDLYEHSIVVTADE